MDRLKRIIVLLAFVSPMLMRSPAQAETLPSVALTGPNGLLRAGDTIPVTVTLDSGGRLINALDVHIAYSPQYLEVLRVDQSQSVWPLWPEQPHWDATAGTLSLVAGRPNGLIAIHAPVATILFRALGTSLTNVVTDTRLSGVYLNDGFGTRLGVTADPLDIQLADSLVPSVALDVATTPEPDTWTSTDSIHIHWIPAPDTQYSFMLSNRVADVLDDSPDPTTGQADFEQQADGVYFFSIKNRVGTGDWSRVSQYRFLLDRTAPNEFSIVPLSSAETHGRPAVSWSTTDATSGVLAQAKLSINGRDLGLATSPVPIKSAWHGKVLSVTVYDAAGNTQSASWRVPGSASAWPDLGYWIGGGLLAIAGSVYIIRRVQSAKA